MDCLGVYACAGMVTVRHNHQRIMGTLRIGWVVVVAVVKGRVVRHPVMTVVVMWMGVILVVLVVVRPEKCIMVMIKAVPVVFLSRVGGVS